MFNQKKFLIGNWKLNPGDSTTALALVRELDLLLPHKELVTVICPPAVYLDSLKNFTNRFRLGAQDVSEFKEGAYTGEISADQLADLGVEYVVLGHSERRQFLGESTECISRKVKAARASGLIPVVCLGFGLKPDAQEAEVRARLRRDCRAIFANQETDRVIIAYEPVWAIGSGKQPEVEHVTGVVNFIKELFNNNEGNSSPPPVLYGGSVNAGNVKSFIPVTDGFLVGGVSLVPEEFAKIAEQLN